ncbi:MAG: exodeoxyribonuclease VII large subunit, partial [Alphaproteobacteria bacterium]
RSRASLDLLSRRLQDRIDHLITQSKTRIDQAGRLLEAGSFQRILERGFALVTGPDGQVMRRPDQYADGAEVRLNLAEGMRQAVLGQSIEGQAIEGQAIGGQAADAPPSKPRSTKSTPKSSSRGDRKDDDGQADLF